MKHSHRLPFSIMLTVLLLVCLTLASCGGEAPITTMTAQESTTAKAPDPIASDIPYSANIFPISNIPDSEMPEPLTVLHSYEQFASYREAYFSTCYFYGDIRDYNEAFFEDRFLIAIFHQATSGTHRPFIDSLTKSDILTVGVGTHTLAQGTDDMWQWLIFVEVSCEDVAKKDRKATLQTLPYTQLEASEYHRLHPEDWQPQTILHTTAQHVAQHGLNGPATLGVHVIGTYEQFLQYQENEIQKLYFYQAPDLSVYDEAFFENHTLLTVLQSAYTGMLRYYVKDVLYCNGYLTVRYGSHLPRAEVTDDTCLGFSLIALPRMEDLTQDDVILQLLPTELIGDKYYELYPRNEH